ncbi:MAG: aldolase, partial [Athalassotoga sp.]
MEIKVPLDVPKDKRIEYTKNYEEMTHGIGRLMLFAGDQKVEHLNKDFYGKSIS